MEISVLICGCFCLSRLELIKVARTAAASVESPGYPLDRGFAVAEGDLAVLDQPEGVNHMRHEIAGNLSGV